MTKKLFQFFDNKIFTSQNYWLCFPIILAISIYIRSVADIGPDSAVYLDVGKKLALGKRYFYDIFEINFPLLMWFYAWQYKISLIIKVHPILLAEFIINFMAIISVLTVDKILKKSTLSSDKNLCKSFVVGIFFVFFIRPFAIHLLEYHTKTSYLIILFFPYFFLNFLKHQKISHQLIKGILMALMIAIKPHYFLLILFTELSFIFLNKKFSQFYSLDKLFGALLYILYLLLILKFNPEYFHDVAEIWNNYFSIYGGYRKYLTNLYSNFAYIILPFFGIFFIYCRFKSEPLDIALIGIFIGSTLTLISENIFTTDQFSLFCSLNILIYLRIFGIIFRTNYFNFSENLFFLGFFIIIPFSMTEFIRIVIFGFSGVFNIWWAFLLYNFYVLYHSINPFLRQKYFNFLNIALFVAVFCGFFWLTILAFGNKNFWLSNFTALILFFIGYFICEKFFFVKISQKLTNFSAFILMASLFLFIHNYTDKYKDFFSPNGFRKSFRQIYDFKDYYQKKYSENQYFQELNFYQYHHLSQPLLTYKQIYMPQKISVFSINISSSYKGMMFMTYNPQINFAYDYIISDLKKMLRDKNTKLIFIDNKLVSESDNKCNIGYLEYIFLDGEIKKLFTENFRYENQLILVKKLEKNIDYYADFFNKNFDRKNFEKNQNKIYGEFNEITYNIELYVRKN